MAALSAAALLLVPLSGCGLFTDDGDITTARDFLTRFAAGDVAGAAGLTDDPEQARRQIEATRKALGVSSITTTMGERRDAPGDSGHRIVDFDIVWRLDNERAWDYRGRLEMREGEDGWRAHWAPSVLHPSLTEGQSLALRAQPAPLTPVLDRDGLPLLSPEKVVTVSMDPAVGDLPSTAAALGEALNRFDASITRESIEAGARGVEAGGPYQVATLRESDYTQVKGAIYDLPGVRFVAADRLLPSTRDFGDQLLTGIRKEAEAQAVIKGGWRIVPVGPDGKAGQPLKEHPAGELPEVRTTVSTRAQSAAERAVDTLDTATMLVAIQPSTGDILAVAQNPAADSRGALALTGRYPPGSSFKIVTAAAALNSGTAADTVLDCPATWTVEGREIPNNDRFELGPVPLTKAFAESCNTTFAKLAVGMPADALTKQAAAFGLGADFVVPGITTITGSVPKAETDVQRAEDGFGQGRVVASPFGMAVVAASVAHGGMITPRLITGRPTKTTQGEATASTEATYQALRAMMREVVISGTAKPATRAGAVAGKTGTAQYGDGARSHGWFVGYRDDVAFAVLITDAGRSLPAVETATRFLTAL